MKKHDPHQNSFSIAGKNYSVEEVLTENFEIKACDKMELKFTSLAPQMVEWIQRLFEKDKMPNNTRLYFSNACLEAQHVSDFLSSLRKAKKTGVSSIAKISFIIEGVKKVWEIFFSELAVGGLPDKFYLNFIFQGKENRNKRLMENFEEKFKNMIQSETRPKQLSVNFVPSVFVFPNKKKKISEKYLSVISWYERAITKPIFYAIKTSKIQENLSLGLPAITDESLLDFCDLINKDFWPKKLLTLIHFFHVNKAKLLKNPEELIKEKAVLIKILYSINIEKHFRENHNFMELAINSCYQGWQRIKDVRRFRKQTNLIFNVILLEYTACSKSLEMKWSEPEINYFPFELLPAEIRTTIYGYLFSDKKSTVIAEKIKQLIAETKVYFIIKTQEKLAKIAQETPMISDELDSTLEAANTSLSQSNKDSTALIQYILAKGPKTKDKKRPLKNEVIDLTDQSQDFSLKKSKAQASLKTWLDQSTISNVAPRFLLAKPEENNEELKSSDYFLFPR